MESAKLDFPMDLNRTSIQKINKKNILNANKCLNVMNIHDYIYINQIVRNMLNDGKNSECFNLGNGKGFSVKEVVDMAKKVTGIDYAPAAIKLAKKARNKQAKLKIAATNIISKISILLPFLSIF